MCCYSSTGNCLWSTTVRSFANSSSQLLSCQWCADSGMQENVCIAKLITIVQIGGPVAWKKIHKVVTQQLVKPDDAHWETLGALIQQWCSVGVSAGYIAWELNGSLITAWMGWNLANPVSQFQLAWKNHSTYLYTYIHGRPRVKFVPVSLGLPGPAFGMSC